MINNAKIGFALCGSFCTFERALAQMEHLVESGAEVYPIMSETAYGSDSRFGSADSFHQRISALCGQEIIHTQAEAEPIGPRKLLDILLIEPCTGNTAAKLAAGITDTAVTLAAKAHLRNGRPLLLAVATNDGLSAAGANIGKLLNTKNVFFVPLGQDNSKQKPRSLVADFSETETAIEAALQGKQLQPIFSYVG